MTDAGDVGFTCRSRECLRTQCKLNLQNPKRKIPVDIFSLIQILYGCVCWLRDCSRWR